MENHRYKYSLLCAFSFYLVQLSMGNTTPQSVEESSFDECGNKKTKQLPPTSNKSHTLEDLAYVCSLQSPVSSSKAPQSDAKTKDGGGTSTHTYNLRSKKTK